MKRIVYALLATVSGLVLMFSYRTSLEVVTPTTEPAAASTTTSGADSTDSTTTDPAPEAGQETTPETTTQTTSSGLQDGTFTGSAVNTRYGPVQVQLTVSGGQISDVQVVEYPNSNRRDQEINQRAIPQLVSETLQSQSAQVDMVSGATYTSTGYAGSLQSALDQAQS
ncbi:FMN-binding protein [Microbacterium istanbulense]|uniref:FMN-binding protein n=1 Tax=Microbacterium istanbulense TaxID=3122049 RepID=A0ABU8LFZ5_9MICO